MSDRSTGFVARRLHEPDLAAGTIGLLVGLALLPLLVVSSDILAQVLPVVLVGGCGLYQLVRDDGRLHDHVSPLERISLPGLEVIAGLTFMGIAGMAAVAVLTGGRTVPFFAVAAATASAIFGQILFGRKDDLRPGLLLFEIVVFSLVLRYAALLTTPGLIGVDAWTHVTDYAAAIDAENSLSAIADEKYYAAPLYHLIVVTVADALRIPLRAALYASIAFVVPVASLFVYAGGRYLLPVRWSLFAVAAFAVADHVVRWGLHLIPTSLGLVFFMGVLYGLARLSVAGPNWRGYALTGTFAFATILTHQLSAFVLLVVLAAAATVSLLAHRDRLPYDVQGGLGVPMLFGGYFVVLLADWAVTPARVGTFLTTMPRVLSEQVLATAQFLDLVSGPSAEAAASISAPGVPFHVALLDTLGFFLLTFVAVIGTLALLRRGSADTITLIVVAALVVTGTFTLILPLFGVTAFIPGRWYGFMYVPMAIVAAFGAWYVAQFVPRRTAVVTLVLFAAIFPAGMLIAHKATLEDQVAESDYARFAYTESELAAVETIGATLPTSRAPLVTDHPYRTVFVRTGAFEAEPLDLQAETPQTYLYRRYQTTGAPVVTVGETPVTTTIVAERYCGVERNRIYANADVTLCTAG